MYHHITGKYSYLSPSSVVVNTGGIGWLVRISLNSFYKINDGILPNIEAVTLFTHLIVKEDSQTLFGFLDQSERDAFLLLISVSGVGATTAMNILSYMLPHEIYSAVANQEKSALTAVKGIGSKTADQILLDLAGKIKEDKESEPPKELKPVFNKERETAIKALVSIGFNKTASSKAVNLAIESGAKEIEGIVKTALKFVK